MADLRSGEVVVQQAGGSQCAVCHRRLSPGQAVQLSRYTTRLRHLECLPATDRRHRPGQEGARVRSERAAQRRTQQRCRRPPL